MPKTSSILGGEVAPTRAKGRDADSLGPSDSSDSGSDVQGERPMPTAADNPGELGAVPVVGSSDSDALGTGERASATGSGGDEPLDILPDRIIDHATQGTAGRGPLAVGDENAPIESMASDEDDETQSGEERAGREDATPSRDEGPARRISAGRRKRRPGERHAKRSTKRR